LVTAEEWHRKALGISEQFGDDYLTSIGYTQLAAIAELRRDANTAFHFASKAIPNL
jgi:hypothetical protein